jgi:hypothetical protein
MLCWYLNFLFFVISGDALSLGDTSPTKLGFTCALTV